MSGYQNGLIATLLATHGDAPTAHLPRKKALSSLVLLLLTGLGMAACGHNIGDSCSTSTDCDPTGGTRSCDLSQPGGYCLIDGCDEYTCPSNSACIRLFPVAFLTKPCDPTAAASATSCNASELCLDIGLCAARSTERRLCLETCGSSSDCRGGYECVQSGTEGSMALVSSGADAVHFCAPVSSAP